VIHRHILQYAGARYLWWSLATICASAALFATQSEYRGWNGGTWQGYTLGTFGALLIVWLTLLGIRKRSYTSGMGSVQGWTSGHVYLGTALIIIATLHCAARFGWNVHTLAYVLMCGVIGSGFVGMYMYLTHPRSIAESHAGSPRAAMFAEVFKLDAQCREFARKCEAAVSVAVKSCIERTVVGGGVLDQLTGRDRSLVYLEDSRSKQGARLVSNADQRAIIEFTADRIPRAAKRAEAAELQSLVTVLCRRQALLRRIRSDIRLQGWLKIWLYVHVPLTFALLVALLVHIVTTFIYW
jgi:hypothetical protein